MIRTLFRKNKIPSIILLEISKSIRLSITLLFSERMWRLLIGGIGDETYLESGIIS